MMPPSHCCAMQIRRCTAQSSVDEVDAKCLVRKCAKPIVIVQHFRPNSNEPLPPTSFLLCISQSFRHTQVALPEQKRYCAGTIPSVECSRLRCSSKWRKNLVPSGQLVIGSFVKRASMHARGWMQTLWTDHLSCMSMCRHANSATLVLLSA